MPAKDPQDGGAEVVIDIVQMRNLRTGFFHQGVEVRRGLSVPDQRQGIAHGPAGKTGFAVVSSFDKEPAPGARLGVVVGHGEGNDIPSGSLQILLFLHDISAHSPGRALVMIELVY